MTSTEPTHRPRRVLIYTGSRCLVDTWRAAVWAARRLDHVFDEVRPDVLVHGNAPGGDQIADDTAAARGVRRAWFDLDGWRYRDGERVAPWTTARREACDPKYWPLHRNRRMLEYCAAQARCELHLYGQHAPWSRTRGTLFTADLAVDMRIELVWVDEAPTQRAA